MAGFLIPSVSEFGPQSARAGTDPFMLLHREVNRLFDDVLRGHSPRGEGEAAMIAPRMDVSETGEELRIDIELPGVPETDVRLELAGDTLTISGEKRIEPAAARRHVAERSFGAFTRTIRLPFAPRPDAVQAVFAHGVLRVTLPLSAPEDIGHRIPVQAGTPAMAEPDEGCLGTAAAIAGHPTPETTRWESDEQEPATQPSSS